MNWQKSHTIQVVLFVLAGALVGLSDLPSLASYKAILVALAGILSTGGLGTGLSSPSVSSSVNETASTLAKIPPLPILALLLTLGLSCTPTQGAAWGHLEPAGACIVNELLTVGIDDPVQILAACAGTTVEDVIEVIAALETAQPDAGALTTRLDAIRFKALALKTVKK